MFTTCWCFSLCALLLTATSLKQSEVDEFRSGLLDGTTKTLLYHRTNWKRVGSGGKLTLGLGYVFKLSQMIDKVYIKHFNWLNSSVTIIILANRPSVSSAVTVYMMMSEWCHGTRHMSGSVRVLWRTRRHQGGKSDWITFKWISINFSCDSIFTKIDIH